MCVDLYTKTILTVIAALLGIVALRPIVQPTSVAAQGSFTGVQVMQTQSGNLLFFDSRNGDLWYYDSSYDPWTHQRITQLGGGKFQEFPKHQ